jgi:PKHD-type hydroxylase
MLLANQYWYFKSQLSNYFCDSVVNYFNQQKDYKGVTGNIRDIKNKLGEDAKDKTEEEILKIAKEKKLKELDDLKKHRNSNIVWSNETWLYNEIIPYIRTANENSNWNFQWDWCESIQFTKYKLNQHYDWHKDSWQESYSKEMGINYAGKIRKLSCIISLSDSSEYKGGELEFCFDNNEPDKPRNIIECKEVKPKGSIIVFPSHTYHRVKPVTEGSRYSLVLWCLGQPFK